MGGLRDRTQLSSLVKSLLGPLQGEGSGTAEDLVRVLSQAVDADACVLLQMHPGKGTGRVLGASGLHLPVTGGLTRLESRYLADRAADSEGADALVLEGPFADDTFLTGEDAAAVIIKTLHVGDTLLAAAALRRDQTAFSREEIDRFTAVAGVVNFRQYLCRLAREHAAFGGADRLPGLGYFAHFHNELVKEVSRARRGGGTLSMGIMSVVSGESERPEDRTLEAARALRDKLRNFDTLDRFGYTELAFILPDLGSADGVGVVDRVLGEVTASLGGPGAAPDICIGLACYPEDGATVERLIEMAEAAMNRAVEAGTPGVYRWTGNET